jgi:protoheme IX farnesyltransferase
LKQRDYSKAGVPMAPLVWGEQETMSQMFWYTLILLALSVMPFAFGAFGIIYLASAMLLGLTLLGGIVRMRLAKEWTAPAWWVYKYSLLYLALLFVAMAADRKIGL